MYMYMYMYVYMYIVPLSSLPPFSSALAHEYSILTDPLFPKKKTLQKVITWLRKLNNKSDLFEPRRAPDPSKLKFITCDGHPSMPTTH